ncbi:MAG: dTDP-4-dehydrorhamnose 3,5-epimerase [Deltaproteobacteria bacterium]|nr:dTDP-4-dehydrorhamnose 3,5-epimerase [Deltaproteobacteria bacterium]
MNFLHTAIPDVMVIEPKVFGDDRGFFMETWQADKFAHAGITATFVQDNHSKSRQGTLRGLHYQNPQPQGKLVRVVSGEVFDVVVDIRRSSPYFGQTAWVLLSAENKLMLWVPPGLAHGFYVTSPEAEFFYKCTDYWAPAYEQSIIWNDPDLAIPWPLIDGQTPSLSEKDKQGKRFKDAIVFD